MQKQAVAFTYKSHIENIAEKRRIRIGMGSKRKESSRARAEVLRKIREAKTKWNALAFAQPNLINCTREFNLYTV